MNDYPPLLGMLFLILVVGNLFGPLWRKLDEWFEERFNNNGETNV